MTAQDVAAEFRAQEQEALDTAKQIEKRLALGINFGNDRLLAAHYRKNAKHYGDRAAAIEAATSPSDAGARPPVCTCRHDSGMSTDCAIHYPKVDAGAAPQAADRLIGAAQRFVKAAEQYRIYSELSSPYTPTQVTVDMLKARDALNAYIAAAKGKLAYSPDRPEVGSRDEMLGITR